MWAVSLSNLTYPFRQEPGDGHMVQSADDIRRLKSINRDNLLVLLFWGGPDLHPAFYGGTVDGSRVGAAPSSRDETEWEILQEGIRQNCVLVGVCRGAHLVCAAAGGKIVQHVSGHVGAHPITIEADVIKKHTGRTVESKLSSNSLHHQMMFPWNVSYELWGWSTKRLSTVYRGLTFEETKQMNSHPEPEIVYFPDIKGLAIQGHPEYLNIRHPYVSACRHFLTVTYQKTREYN